MNTINIVFGIILLVAAVFLVIAVLMQSGKSHNLSGAIAGGAESFFGKTKGKTIDRVLSKVTTIVAIVFVLLVIVVYVVQPDTDFNAMINQANVETLAPEDIEVVAEDAAEELVEGAEEAADAIESPEVAE